MDDIFDGLIYVIITIVAFAISILGKKKKKEAQRTSVNEEEFDQTEKEENSVFPELKKLIREQTGIQNQYVYEKEYVEQEIIEEEIEEKPANDVLDVVPPHMLDDKEDEPYSIEYQDTSEKFSDPIKDSDLTQEEENAILVDFNLQDAVIYSEIINRKEF
ncbi:MAG: hypothetical protein KOO66_08395 [Bacteroidales bacterium]|nr:hypothetical protein [Bacteroidales bacterium]